MSLTRQQLESMLALHKASLRSSDDAEDALHYLYAMKAWGDEILTLALEAEGYQSRVAELTAALGYYAEARNYGDKGLPANDAYDSMKLPGSRARAAMEGQRG